MDVAVKKAFSNDIENNVFNFMCFFESPCTLSVVINDGIIFDVKQLSKVYKIYVLGHK